MMKHKEIHLIIVADETTSKVYGSYLTTRGVTFYLIKGKNQIENILEIIPINGILVDQKYLETTPSQESNYLAEMAEQYPLAYSAIDEANPIPLAFLEQNSQKPLDIDEFIFTYCAGVPRLMRTSLRKKVSLNIMLCSEPSFTTKVERSCTYDISDMGLFVITSATHWVEGQRIFVVINELTLKTPIVCSIIRVTPWGSKAAKPPGVSLRFDAILDSQQDEIYHYIQK